jgi:Leucine-rich repeat (LRR) protein
LSDFGFRVSLSVEAVKGAINTAPPVLSDRQAAEQLLAIGAHLWIEVAGEDRPVQDKLPQGEFKLTTVNLDGNKLAGDDTLRHLRGLANLKGLSLNPAAISDAGMEHLRGLPQLRGLTLDSARVTGKGVAVLQSVPKLESLNLVHADISDADLVPLKDLKLRALNIVQTKVTGSGFEHLRKMKLTDLSLGGTPLQDDALDLLHKAVPDLVKLELNGYKLPPEIVRKLSKFEKLTTLSVCNSDVVCVDEAGLAEIGKLTQLETLDISQGPITDQNLRQLQPLTKLKELNLRLNKVTQTGVDAFHAAVPGCKIFWDGGEIPAASRRSNCNRSNSES